MAESVSENGSFSDHEENHVVRREVNEKDTVPLDNYCLVGWDLDTTGRRLLDEICHIAGYTPEESFSEYIMPHGDFTPEATKRHMLRIETVRMYRVLRDLTTGRGLKTRIEIAAMTDFLEWLENICEKTGKSGVLLITHERFKFNPYIFIKSLQEYNLLERFQKTVKGFVDCHHFAEKMCEQTMVSFSIRILSRVLLDKDNVEIYKASDRACLAYEIVQHLSAGASEIGKGATSPNEEIVKCVLPYAVSIEAEMEELDHMRMMIGKQNTLKPIFGYFMRFSTPQYKRKIALRLRRYLVDAFMDYDVLKGCWTEKGKSGIEELLKEKLGGKISDRDHEELLKMISDHFENPDKEMGPPRQNRYPRRSYRGNRSRDSPPEKQEPAQEPTVPVAVAVN